MRITSQKRNRSTIAISPKLNAQCEACVQEYAWRLNHVSPTTEVMFKGEYVCNVWAKFEQHTSINTVCATSVFNDAKAPAETPPA